MANRLNREMSESRLNQDHDRMRTVHRKANRQIFFQTLGFCLCWLPRQVIAYLGYKLYNI